MDLESFLHDRGLWILTLLVVLAAIRGLVTIIKISTKRRGMLQEVESFLLSIFAALFLCAITVLVYIYERHLLYYVLGLIIILVAFRFVHSTITQIRRRKDRS